MKTMAEAIEAAIQDRVRDVRFWVAYGMTFEAAAAKAKENSCLGPKSWARVLELASAPK